MSDPIETKGGRFLFEMVDYIRVSGDAQFHGRGSVTNYVAPNGELGEITGTYTVLDHDTNEEHEIDERDVWSI